MKPGVELLYGLVNAPIIAEQTLTAIITEIAKEGWSTCRSSRYMGQHSWLMLFGVGAKAHHEARVQHLQAGGTVLHWDLGYFGRSKGLEGCVRFCINSDHPHALLDKVPAGRRWNKYGIELREDCDPKGHIVLVGMGPKQRRYVGPIEWEEKTYTRLTQQYPGVRIVYRPKKITDDLYLPCESNRSERIEDVIRGARLVVCRHSNVAVDAVVAGVPFEAEDGAAIWLKGKPYTREKREEFLQRLSWFNWHWKESREAWVFIKRTFDAP